MNHPDGPEERQVEFEEQLERDIDQMDLDDMLADEYEPIDHKAYAREFTDNLVAELRGIMTPVRV